MSNSASVEEKIDLGWLRTHIPIFAKMEQETMQRKQSELDYRLKNNMPCKETLQ